MKRNVARAFLAFAAVLLPPCVSAGRIVLPSDGPGGMMCHYYDFGLRVPWQGGTPRSIDAKGALDGDAPFASAPFGGVGRSVTLDVTAALRASSRGVPGALLLRTANPTSGTALFASRESKDGKPTLTVVTKAGATITATPVADSTIDCTTSNPLGGVPGLWLGPRQSAILRFDLGDSLADLRVAKLTVELQQTTSVGAVSVFALALPVDPAVPEETRGLASGYPGDRGIGGDPDVLFAEQFESRSWSQRWSSLDFRSRAALTDDDEAHGFRPLRDRALRVTLAKGANLALDLRYRLGTKTGQEPSEAYFRYYLRFGDDWGSDVDGGKLPGLSGTYGRAGWGGRNPDGHNGWNMRMTFAPSAPPGHPGRNLVAVGSEAALPRQRTSIAPDNAAPRWPWTNGFLGVLEKSRWYCIEQHVRLNSPDASDGVFEAWVDGELAITRSNIDFRYDSGLRIQEIWLDIYHGGIAPAAREQHLYIDNVVVARRYIGPMGN